MDKTGNAFYGPVTFHGPMFDIHDNQQVIINNGQLTIDNCDTGKNNCQSSIVNSQLDSPDALALLERLRRAGVADEAWRPVGLSSAEKGVLASYIAARLGIATPWQTFARLWGMRPDTLRAAYNKGMEQKKTARFLERVKEGG